MAFMSLTSELFNFEKIVFGNVQSTIEGSQIGKKREILKEKEYQE